MTMMHEIPAKGCTHLYVVQSLHAVKIGFASNLYTRLSNMRVMPGLGYHTEDDRDRADAASEIADLRARLAQAEQSKNDWRQEWEATVRALNVAEVRAEQLEAALREIGREQSDITARHAADRFQKIAREALASPSSRASARERVVKAARDVVWKSPSGEWWLRSLPLPEIAFEIGEALDALDSLGGPQDEPP